MAENINPNTAGNVGGESPREERIEQLQKSLAKVEVNIQEALDDSKGLIFVSFLGCAIIVFFGCKVICKFLEEAHPPCEWTWQFLYYTTIRITAISAIFAIATFVFKIFRSYLNIYQRNRDKLTVIQSMAYLVESSSTYAQREMIYLKLLEIVINPGDIGLVDAGSKDEILSSSVLINKFLEALKSTKKGD